MITTDILIDYIKPNPWQPRESEDAEHIKNLALSIAEDGLMQLPVGRLLDANGEPCGINEALKYADVCETVPEAWEYILKDMGCTVQLAFGHSRLAAYKWLVTVQPTSNLVGDWSKMPVVLRDLDDLQMAEMAIAENVQRKDLSAIEEARAMQRLRSDFGKGSADIGLLFGLDQSTVRNKMRLLQLPEDVQAALVTGQISEGAARELLSLYDLPTDLLNCVRGTIVVGGIRLNEGQIILNAALAGETADQIHNRISRLIKDAGKNLSQAEWKWDDAIDPAIDARIVNDICRGCPRHIKRESNDYCVSQSCYTAREELRRREILARASAETGIRPIENVSKGVWDYARLPNDGEDEIRGSGCENLRLIYADYLGGHETGVVVGHPKAQVVCSRNKGQCSCEKGIEARRKLAAAGIRVEKTVGQMPTVKIEHKEAERSGALPGQTRPTSAQDLKEFASQARREKSQLREEVKAMQDELARRMAEAMMNMNGTILLRMLDKHFSYQKREEFRGVSGDAIIRAACLAEAQNLYDLQWNPIPNPGDALRRFNEILASADLPLMIVAVESKPAYEPEPVYEAIEETEKPRVGKTLVDVFQDEEDQQGHMALDAVTDGDLLPGQMPGETLAAYFARTDGE